MKIRKIGRTLLVLRMLWKGAGEFVHLLSGASVICLLDQMFKHSIDAEPEENFPRELPSGKGRVGITRAHNTGFSQERLSQYPELVRMTSLALTAFVGGILQVFCLYFPGKRKIEKFGASLLLGGAISNTYDRLAHHFVTDYLHIKIGPLKKSIINLGDIAIVSGAAIYMIGAVISAIRGRE